MDLVQRKKIRLSNFDYSSRGAYFITICVTDRHALLWEQGTDITLKDQPPLNQNGSIVQAGIEQITAHYQHVIVDKYCIMPDHVHMIIFVLPNEEQRIMQQGGGARASTHVTLSSLIGSMKRWVSKEIGYSLWQKSFHDKVLWRKEDYDAVWKYIDENPLHYKDDCLIES